MQDAMQCNALLLTAVMDRFSDDMFKLYMADLSTVRVLFFEAIFKVVDSWTSTNMVQVRENTWSLDLMRS
jgi:hypothetical protein